jgi:hypothetical protein
VRCGRIVGSASAFAVSLWAEGERLLYDVVFVKNAPENGMLMHMAADRECKTEISAYVGKLLRNLGLPETCDTSFLERL